MYISSCSEAAEAARLLPWFCIMHTVHYVALRGTTWHHVLGRTRNIGHYCPCSTLPHTPLHLFVLFNFLPNWISILRESSIVWARMKYEIASVVCIPLHQTSSRVSSVPFLVL